jgi:hypothetical protein
MIGLLQSILEGAGLIIQVLYWVGVFLIFLFVVFVFGVFGLGHWLFEHSSYFDHTEPCTAFICEVLGWFF